MKGLIQGYIHLQTNDLASPTTVIPIVGYAADRAAGGRTATGVQIDVSEWGALVPGRGKLVAKYRVANRLGPTI